MLNLLQSLRYFIFGVFVICSAIITSVAVWNLSIVQSVAGADTAREIDAYLIFVGASGLLLIFFIIFCELAARHLFLVRVWFELTWVGAFWVMQLIGAAVITSQSNSQLCAAVSGAFPSFSSSQESPCASSQVLQAFTWISAILLLGYFTLLSILTIVKLREDPTILQCSVHRFPVGFDRRTLKSVPTSPSIPRFRAQSPPIIAAPRPRRLANLAQLRAPTTVSHRSALSLEYEIEHYPGGPPPQNFQAASSDGHARNTQTAHATSNDGHTFSIHIPQTGASSPPPLQPLRHGQQYTLQPPPQPAQPDPPQARSTPFYHSSVKTAINKEGPQLQLPAPVQLSSSSRLQPSPPPLGDWPRLDSTSRPRMKRKPLPRPLPDAELQLVLPSRMNSQSQGPPRPQPLPPTVARAPSQSRALPPQPPAASPPAQYSFDAPALAARLEPLAAQPTSWRSKPTGPRRRSDSIDDGRPAHLDLSNISSFHSPGFGPR